LLLYLLLNLKTFAWTFWQSTPLGMLQAHSTEIPRFCCFVVVVDGCGAKSEVNTKHSQTSTPSP